MISGDQLFADVRDIFYTHQAQWLSLSDLVANLKVQPYAAYHPRGFDECRLKRRLADFGIAVVRRGTRPGLALDNLLHDRVKRYAPGAPRIVRVASDSKEEADGPPNLNQATR
jgi:hypothetical protein